VELIATRKPSQYSRLQMFAPYEEALAEIK